MPAKLGGRLVKLLIGFEALIRTPQSGKFALISKPGAYPVASTHVAAGEYTVLTASQK
jgi:hypothetical protein